MRSPFFAALLSLATASALAQECQFPQREPVERHGQMIVRFIDSCGRPYEVEYRLDGNTLHFPRGGTHALPNVSSEEAERVLRETYGLQGERDALIRTGEF